MSALHGMSDGDISSSTFKAGRIGKPPDVYIPIILEGYWKNAQMGSKMLKAATIDLIGSVNAENSSWLGALVDTSC